MTPEPSGPPTPVEAGPHTERDRRRPARWVLLVGAALSLLGALAVGVLGASGAASLTAALVGGAVTCAAAGLVTLVGAVRDELRDRPVPPRRIARGVLLLLAAPVLLLLAAGAAGSA